MLVILPAYIAAGFCVGFIAGLLINHVPALWKSHIASLLKTQITVHLSENKYVRPAVIFLLAVLVCLLTALIYLIVVRLVSLNSLSAKDDKGQMLGFAGFIFGMIGGVWYPRSDNGRDQLAFIAAGGLLLFIIAMEYDYGTLGHLTKLDAGTVDIEFSTPGSSWSRQQKPDYTPRVSASEGDFAFAFPGGARITYVIYVLQDLGEAILRDEKYARIFARVPNLAKDAKFSDGMEEPTLRFAKYACGAVKALADNLRILQNYHHSETSLYAMNPLFIAIVRKAYLQALHGKKPYGHDPGVNIREAAAPDKTDLQLLTEEIVERAKAEVHAAALDDQANNSHNNEGGSVSDQMRCGDLPKDAPADFEDFDPPDKAEGFSYIAYFALTAALAEFASGNRENAIRLLEREIERQKEQRDRLYSSSILASDPGACSQNSTPASTDKCPAAERLKYFRRLAVLLRLEVVQANMMLWSDNNAIMPVWLDLLITMTKDYQSAFVYLGGEDKTDQTLLPPKFDPSNTKSCNLVLPGDSDGSDLLKRFLFTMLTMENTAVWLAAESPEAIDVRPDWRKTFDEYADSLSSFEVGCLTGPGTFKPDWRARARQLDSVARYWKMIAEREDSNLKGVSRASGSESDPSKAINALCKSLKAYNDEERAVLQETTRRPSEDQMFRALSDYNQRKSALELDEGRKQVVRLLDRYPKTDVKQGCSETN